MSWFLKASGRADPTAPQPAPLDAPLPSVGRQMMTAAAEQFMVANNAQNKALHAELLTDDIARALNSAAAPTRTSPFELSLAVANRQRARIGDLLDQVADLRQFDPATFGQLPASRAEFEAEVNRRDKAVEDEMRALLSRGDSPVAQGAGAIAGAVIDPLNIAMATLGGPTGTGVRGALRFGAGEAALGAAAEVPTVLNQQERAERLGSPEPNAAAQLAMGAGAGFVLGTAIGGAANYLAYRKARRTAEAETGDPDTPPLEAEARAQAAERALREGREPAPLAYTNQNATRNQPLVADLESAIRRAVADVYGPGYRIEVYSGGQPAAGTPGKRVGTVRHDGGRAADVYIVGPDGKRVTGDNLAPLARYWRERNLGGVGLEMRGGGIHLDNWTTPPAGGGMAWSYGPLTPAQQAALAAEGGAPPAGAQGTGTGAPALPDGPGFSPSAMRRGQTAPDEVVSPTGMRARVEYRVVDMASMRQATGALQNRDRTTRIASDEQVDRIARELDPALLMPGPFADRGAPVVGPDGVIESGNGRVRALGRVAEQDPAAYGAYVEAIRSAGFEVPEGMARPVLIAQRVDDGWTPAQRRDWVTGNNAAASMRLSGAEQALTDADYLGPALPLFRPGARLAGPENAGFVRAVLGQMPPAERAAMWNADGSLSLDGLLRLRRALFARAFGADDIVRMAIESEHPTVQALVRMLEDIAPDWAAFRSSVDAGLVRAEFDITADLMAVVRTIAQARIADREGQSVVAAVRDVLGQADMFAPARDAELSEALLNAFYKGDRARRPDATGDILRRYAAEAQTRGRADTDDLLGDPIGPAQALRAAADGHERRTPYEAPEPPEAPPAPEVPDIRAIDPGPVSDGIASAAVRAADDALEADVRARADAEHGPFGPIRSDLSSDWRAATDFLLTARTGEVPDALRHPDVTDPDTGAPLGISLVYGEAPRPGVEGWGVAKLAAKHPEVLSDLPAMLGRMTVDRAGSGPNRIRLTDANGVAVIRLDFVDAMGASHKKTWLLTAYERRGADRAATTDTGIALAPGDTAGRGVGTGQSVAERAAPGNSIDDDPGQIAGQLRTSNEPTASASSRIPDATGQPNDSVRAPADQGGDAQSRAIAEAIASLPQPTAQMRALDDLPIPLADGPGAPAITARELLDEIDEQADLFAAMSACAVKGTAP